MEVPTFIESLYEAGVNKPRKVWLFWCPGGDRRYHQLCEWLDESTDVYAGCVVMTKDKLVGGVLRYRVNVSKEAVVKRQREVFAGAMVVGVSEEHRRSNLENMMAGTLGVSQSYVKAGKEMKRMGEAKIELLGMIRAMSDEEVESIRHVVRDAINQTKMKKQEELDKFLDSLF
jgi:hypothetical protein